MNGLWMDQTVLAEVRERDRDSCRFCGDCQVAVHHIVYRSHGGPDEPWNLISLCRTHHDWVHRINFPKWYLHLMARTGLMAKQLFWTLQDEPLGWGDLQAQSCLSCERRDEAGLCELWEHDVDWDYRCDYWRCRPLPNDHDLNSNRS